MKNVNEENYKSGFGSIYGNSYAVVTDLDVEGGTIRVRCDNFDITQEVAKQYDAVCTPDFFGFDKYKTLRYRGRIDNSGLKNEPNATRELYLSMKAIKENKIISYNNPSIGCSIKWKNTG